MNVWHGQPFIVHSATASHTVAEMPDGTVWGVPTPPLA